MQVQQISIHDITPYENNARFNDEAVDFVKNSIKEFGFQQPIVVDKDNVIIAGHTRYKAAREIGMKTVPTIVAADLTEEQAKAYRLADNKTGEIAEWDFDKLVQELDDIDLNTEIDMSEFGFPESELEDEEVALEEDEEPTNVKERTKLGQIWALGNNRLMVGDSTKKEQVLKLLNGEKANLLLTDPPYNISYTGRTESKMKIKNDSMDENNFNLFLIDSFLNVKEYLTKNASAYVWFSQLHAPAFFNGVSSGGLMIRQQLIWNKNTITMGAPYRNKYEPCLFLTVGKDYEWFSDKSQPTVLDFDRPNKSDLHPTMKPIALFDYQIKNSTNKKGIVLDLFAGSGTTIIACEQNERKSYNMELDPHYADVILQRWENLTGKEAKLVE